MSATARAMTDPKLPCRLCSYPTRRRCGGVPLCSECRAEDLVRQLVEEVELQRQRVLAEVVITQRAAGGAR